MAVTVTEREAREVAEAARETEWKLPSFGKELFLGNLRLDLIHPQPRARSDRRREGRALPATPARVPRASTSTRSRSSATRRSPTRSSTGSRSCGALGHEGARAVRRPRARRRSTTTARSRWPARWHAALSTLLSAHQSIGVAEPLMLFGSEEQKREWLPLVAQGPHLGVPAHRARRRLRPGAARHHRDADRGRSRLRAQRHQAVGDQRRDRRHRRGDGAGAEVRRPRAASPRSSCAYDTDGDHGRAPQRSSWACAGSRTR